jgi:NAD(P)H dehydrogenase (quinone)
MQHLVVVCHPKRQSFVQSIAKAYGDALKSEGHSVVVRDLYRAHFDPLLGEAELNGRTPARIRREQRYIAEAAAIAFFFPVWWGYMPAMLKGYLDRVFSQGFAYEADADNMAPLLSGKKAMVFTSSGADMTYLRRSKQWQAMRLLLDDHFLALCGIDLLEHIHFPTVTPDMTEKAVAKHLVRVRGAVAQHWAGTAVPAG